MTRSRSWEYSSAFTEARLAAQDALGMAGIANLPVDPFCACEALGIVVVTDEQLSPGIAGSTQFNGRDFRVVLGGTANFGFLNFTLAHEIGHACIESHRALFLGGKPHYSGEGFADDNLKERQADHFAAAFLMPEAPCRAILDAIPDDKAGMQAIEQLQSQCNVSLTAAAIRYAELTSHLAAVIVSTNGKVDYCIRSQELIERVGYNARIAKGAALPVHTPSANLAKDASSVAALVKKDSGDIRWNMWFGSNRGDVYEEAKGLGKYGKVLTVMTANG